MSVLSEVRAITRDVHQSLDDHPLLVRFMSQGHIEAYQNFLQTFSLFERVASAKAAKYIDAEDLKVLDYDSWGIFLQSDLERLPEGDDFSFAERYTHLLPDIRTRSEFWGLLYVLEGSTLGGTQVAATLPKDWPSEFLRRGTQAKLRWPYFCRRLGELSNAGDLLNEDVADGAVKAFNAMIRIFDACLKVSSGDKPRRATLPGNSEAASDMD